MLAGHRDTVFRRLGEVGEGDKLIVNVSMPKATITISTCYPFRFIGSAPQRYVLVAYLASINQSKKKNER